jgi:hypothetical protein
MVPLSSKGGTDVRFYGCYWSINSRACDFDYYIQVVECMLLYIRGSHVRTISDHMRI